MTRVALLTEVPAPFRTPLFNALADRVELEVLFLAARDPRRAYRLEPERYRFAYRVLTGRDLRLGTSWLVLSAGVSRALASFRPDVVLVGGWSQPAYWSAARWSKRSRVPVVAWVESTAQDSRSERRAVEAAKRRFARSCAAFVVPGGAAAQYVSALGVRNDRIVVAPNAVDLPLFEGDREAARSARGLERTAFLTVARLAPEKGLDLLFRAATELEADMIVAGSGPEERRLRALAPANVRFLGHVEHEELPAWYASVDAFVLPSRSEPWGIALGEAAAAGLPLVASEAVGAAWDLIEEGVNGFRVPTGDAAALHRALRRLATSEELRATAAVRSRELAAAFTPAAWADALARLLERLGSRP